MTSTRQRYIAAADKMREYVERLKALQAPSPTQVRALVTDLDTEVRNLRSALAAEEDETSSVGVGGDTYVGGLFVSPSDDAYIVGGSPGNPNGVTFTVNDAIRWYQYVWSHGVGYHHVRPTLLPGAHALTPAGVAFARAYQEQPGLDEAPEDFNPLNLSVVP